MTGLPPVPAEGLARAQRRLADFAATFPELRLYRRICEAAATDSEVAGMLTRAGPGQDRPVLLLAALHELVLDRPDLPAARWYPSVTGVPVPGGDPWPDVRAALRAFAGELQDVIATRSTQTNEVNRAVYLAPLLARAGADLPGAPVALLELGCSAGLLLGLDRYRIAIRPEGGGEPAVLGDPTSPVRCEGVGRGAPLTGARLPRIVERVGLDRSPVALDDEDAVRWLEACLWPEVPGRLERFRSAVARLAADPPDVAAGDMAADVAAVGRSARAVAAASAGVDPATVHLVVMSSWALTYVARDQRPQIADALAGLASGGRPVSWLTAEPPGCGPGLPAVDVVGEDIDPAGLTVLGARRWRRDEELPPAVWGTAHPHGEWIRWSPPS